MKHELRNLMVAPPGITLLRSMETGQLIERAYLGFDMVDIPGDVLTELVKASSRQQRVNLTIEMVEKEAHDAKT